MVGRLMKRLNKIGKKYVDEIFMLAAGVFLWQLYLNTTMGRTGLGAQGLFTTVGVGVALIVVGWILIIIPELTTTITGVVLVGVGASMIGGVITYLGNLIGRYASNPKIIIGGMAAILLFLYIRNRPRPRPMIYRQPIRRF